MQSEFLSSLVIISILIRLEEEEEEELSISNLCVIFYTGENNHHNCHAIKRVVNWSYTELLFSPRSLQIDLPNECPQFLVVKP